MLVGDSVEDVAGNPLPKLLGLKVPAANGDLATIDGMEGSVGFVSAIAGVEPNGDATFFGADAVETETGISFEYSGKEMGACMNEYDKPAMVFVSPSSNIND